MMILFLILLSLFNVSLFHWLGQDPSFYRLDAYTWESVEFRGMRLGPAIAGLTEVDCERLSGFMLDHAFDLTEFETEADLSGPLETLDILDGRRLLLEQKSAAYKKLCHAYEIVFSDLKYPRQHQGGYAACHLRGRLAAEADLRRGAGPRGLRYHGHGA